MTDATLDFSLRRAPQFLRFWSGRVASAAGNQMLTVAVGWHMYDLTNSAWDLGLIGLCQFLPALVLTLPAGHAADHGHRGCILAICMAVQALTGVGLALAELSHWVDRNLLLTVCRADALAHCAQSRHAHVDVRCRLRCVDNCIWPVDCIRGFFPRSAGQRCG